MEIEKLTPEIIQAISEIQQPRSKFQLDKFVINQHDTDEMRYFQTVLEIQQLYNGIRKTVIKKKQLEIQIERLMASEDEIDQLEAQGLVIDLEECALGVIGARREIEHLMDIFNSFPKKFTRDEIEDAQPDYWMKRMHRQTTLEFAGGTQAAAAHLDSLRQMGVLKVTENGIEAVETEPILKEIKDGATR